MEAALAKDDLKARRVWSKVEEITPEIATKWLEKQDGNRNVVQAVVERYARDMQKGNWRLTGEAIKFGVSGRLYDGQHRLWACILADTAFECLVVGGIPDEDDVMDVMDTGLKRTLGHALQIHGEKDAALLAAIVNMCAKYDRDKCQTFAPITHAEGLGWLSENGDVREAIRVARNVFTRVRAHPSSVGAAYYLNGRVDGEKSGEFWEGVITGAGMEAGDPRLAYQRWIVSTLAKRDKPRPVVWLAYNLKAMNLWRDGKHTRILSVKASEGMPEVWS